MTEQTREIYDLEAPFKYTFPIEKAFVGDDGKRRLVGAATGPEVDLQGERIHPSLIDKWVDYINGGGEVIYRDWHKKDTTTADLGVVEKAWKDEKGHMWIQVVLDDDNPVSQYIHKSAMKGKQYGMSVYGKVLRFADEFVPELGRKVRTFYDAILDEVSNTTRPVWTPSLGTVLSKAVNEEMSHAAEGDNSNVADNTQENSERDEQKVVNEAAAKDTTESGAATAPDTGSAPDVEVAGSTDTKGQNVVDATEQVVEKAVTADTKKDAKRLANIVKLHTALGKELAEIGLLDADTTEPEAVAEETTVQKSEGTDDDRIARIEKALGTLSETVLAIAENTPARTAPGLLQKAEESDPVAELKAVADPIERLRLAMAARYGENSTLR